LRLAHDWLSISDLVAPDLAGDEDLRDLLGGLSLEDVHDPSRLPRIRPVLVALAARSAGAARVDKEAQHAAELLHLALVAHDLALGQRGGRRRRVARRILRSIGGNALTLRALELARHAESPEILGEVVDTLREMADGQSLTQDIRRRGLPTQDDWRDHADGHVGAVFSFCCRAGAHIGGGDVAAVAGLGRYGRHMGRLWNVAEDVAALDRPDAAAHLAHRAGVGRPVLPVVRAAERDPEVGTLWIRLAADPQPIVAEALVARVNRVGGAAASREVMAQESWAARRALQAVPPSPYRSGMERLAAGLARPEAA
jgi:geranylgeranyl pyrophosphate synthase